MIVHMKYTRKLQSVILNVVCIFFLKYINFNFSQQLKVQDFAYKSALPENVTLFFLFKYKPLIKVVFHTCKLSVNMLLYCNHS